MFKFFLPSLLLLALACVAATPAGRMDLLCGVHDGGYIRADKPDEKQGNGLMIVGGLDDGTPLRGMFTMDLSAIPEDALIRSAELRLYMHTPDKRTTNGGPTPIELRLLEQRPSHDVTWTGPDSQRTWQTPGGDFSRRPVATAVSDPTGVKGGEALVFENNEALLQAVRKARQQSEPFVNFAVIAPELETQSGAKGRGLLRFQGPGGQMAPMLTLRYDLP